MQGDTWQESTEEASVLPRDSFSAFANISTDEGEAVVQQAGGERKSANVALREATPNVSTPSPAPQAFARRTDAIALLTRADSEMVGGTIGAADDKRAASVVKVVKGKTLGIEIDIDEQRVPRSHEAVKTALLPVQGTRASVANR
jgi:hypothetical protein